MSRQHNGLLDCFARAACIALVLSVPASSQTPTSVNVTDPRPMAGVADLLERRYGIPISYEDPAYMYPGDLVGRVQPNGPAILLPKGGSVAVSIPTGAQIGAPDGVVAILQAALTSYRQAGNSGDFKLLQNDGAILVVPTSVRDLDGVTTPVQSPLDVPISFPQTVGNGVDVVAGICQAVTRASGSSVLVGSLPFQSLATQTVTLSASNETARNVMLRLFAALNWADSRTITPVSKLSWRLLYDAAAHKYYLNLHAVVVEKRGPTGKTSLVPVTR